MIRNQKKRMLGVRIPTGQANRRLVAQLYLIILKKEMKNCLNNERATRKGKIGRVRYNTALVIYIHR